MTEPLTYPHVLRRAYFGTRGARETRDRLNAGTIISAQVCAWWRRCNRGAETSQVTYGTHDGGPESSPTGAQDLWLCADQRTLERQLLYGRDFFSRGSICRLHSLLRWAEQQGGANRSLTGRKRHRNGRQVLSSLQSSMTGSRFISFPDLLGRATDQSALKAPLYLPSWREVMAARASRRH